MLATNSEIDKMKKLFIEIDKNQDGFLSIDELEEGLGKIVGVLQATCNDMQNLLT